MEPGGGWLSVSSCREHSLAGKDFRTFKLQINRGLLVLGSNPPLICSACAFDIQGMLPAPKDDILAVACRMGTAAPFMQCLQKVRKCWKPSDGPASGDLILP